MVHQRVPVAEEDVRNALLLRDLPDSLLVVEIGRVLGKPHHADMLADVGMSQEGGGLLGRVDGSVVQGEDDPLPSPARAQKKPPYEEKELGAVLTPLAHAWNQRAVLPRRVIECAESGYLGVLPGRGHLHLSAPSHPSPGQVRVKMEVGLVLEPEFVSGSWAKSPFFRA